MAAPGKGNVYVTGQIPGKVKGQDCATIAYDDFTGAQLWVRRYSGPATSPASDDFAVRWPPARAGHSSPGQAKDPPDSTSTPPSPTKADPATRRVARCHLAHDGQLGAEL